MKFNYKKSFLSFFSGTLIFRSISFFRELILAWFIGPGKVLDIFFFLITVPNMVNFTWNKALETTLLKRYELYRYKRNDIKANIDLHKHIYSFISISIMIYLLLSISFPLFIFLFYSKFFSISIIYAVLFINSIFILETYILIFKIKQYSDQRFFLPSILPGIQSIILIIGIIGVKEQYDLIYLSILYALGGVSQLLIFFIDRKNIYCRFKYLRFQIKQITTIFGDSIKLMIASGLSSLNIFVDQSFALRLGENLNSLIHYGNYFLTFYLALFVRNINTIYFPQFQKYMLANEQNLLVQDVRKLIKIILIISVFIIVLIINSGHFILDLILGHGRMTNEDILIIYYCTLGYTGAFLGTALNAIIIRILHVYSEYHLLLLISIVNVTINFVFNYIFSIYFGIWGIALSTSLSFLLIVTIYLIYLKIKHGLMLFDNIDNWLFRYFIAVLFIIVLEFIYLNNHVLSTNITFYSNILILFSTSVILFVVIFGFRLINLKDNKIKI